MNRRFLVTLGLAAITFAFLPACTHRPVAKSPGREAASQLAPPLEFDERWDSTNDDQTDQVIAISERTLADRFKDESVVRRDAHPKHHGCAKAFFDVDSSALPAELRVGVFAEPMKSHLPAWVRFSNGNPDGAHAPDIDKDFRGMAVKLMNVPGSSSGSQDFIMLTSKEFFSRDAADYFSLSEALNGSKVALGWYFATHWQQAGIFLGGRVQAANPLQVEYFSSVPYKLGPRSMKFKARPCPANELHDQLPDGNPARDYLRERLASSLSAKPACYEFLVQPNMDPDSNPVENPMGEWNERSSPYLKVATLTFPVQKGIDSAEQLNVCENLSFNPWNSMPETRPVGQINRMRARIYSAISELRHRANHVPLIEPKSHETCTGDTAPLCQTPKR
jgi:hypothetical protein